MPDPGGFPRGASEVRLKKTRSHEAQEAPQKSSRVSAMILSGIQKLEVGLWGALHHSIIVLLY